MTSESFEILNEKEEKLIGVIETLHPRKKVPVVVLLNGFLDTMETEWKQKLALRLRKAGYATVLFDYSYGFGMGSGDAAKFTLSNAVIDTQRAAEYVTRRAYIIPDRIAVIGHCYGGMAALLYSAFEPRVKAVVTMSTPYEFMDSRITRVDDREMSRIRLKRYFHMCGDEGEVRIDYSFFEDGTKKDMARATRNIRQPILILHGRNDESIPLSNAQEIYDRVPGKRELHVLDSMTHHPTDLKEIGPLIEKFMKKHL